MLEFYQIESGELKKIKISQSKKGTFKKNGKKKYLLNNEIQEIIKLYPDYFNWQIERMFNISQSTILNIRRKHNLKKSKEIIDAHRFKKGNIPFNKGQRHNYPNSGQFIKGHIPKNHKPIGSIRISYKNKEQQYYEIKINEPNKWALLHRYIWEQNYGKIPKGYIITFKDKNTFNYELSNLKMISRIKNLIRNQDREKAAKSLKKTWDKEKQRIKYGLPQKTKFRIRN